LTGLRDRSLHTRTVARVDANPRRFIAWNARGGGRARARPHRRRGNRWGGWIEGRRGRRAGRRRRDRGRRSERGFRRRDRRVILARLVCQNGYDEEGSRCYDGQPDQQGHARAPQDQPLAPRRASQMPRTTAEAG
jgi:hypothetical protein